MYVEKLLKYNYSLLPFFCFILNVHKKKEYHVMVFFPV